MNKKRKIAIITGTRAEYGLLYWLMKAIQDDIDLELQVIATGMHLSPEFGLTYKEIEKDGFRIDEKVEMLLSSDTPVGTAKSTGLGVIGFADAFSRLRPDVVVLLGDRFEMLSAAVSAHVMGFPIAHIHGGEVTEGAIDDAIRHSITKMSSLHFVAAEEFRKRVIQMGERPERVFTVGALGLENVTRLELVGRADLEEFVGIPLKAPFFVVTFHPETLGGQDPVFAARCLLEALDQFPEATVIFTLGNADSGGRMINSMIREYVSGRKSRAVAFQSMGHLRYLSALRFADVVIGNSSSGIIEAPSFHVPVVNIGDRQKGRPRAASIIDCRVSRGQIAAAIGQALSPAFRSRAGSVENPYFRRGTSGKILDVLTSFPLDPEERKGFYDLP